MGKVIRTPIVLATADNLANATPLEPLYDKKNNDIIIMNKDGKSSNSIYKSFKEKLVQDGYMSSKYLNNIKDRKIYGFTINLEEHDPSDAVTYTNNCADFAPIKFGTGKCDYGSWYNVIKDYFGITPCLLKPNGSSKKELIDTDYTKLSDGVSIADVESGGMGDVVIRFTKKYYKIEVSDTVFSFKVANYKVDDSYICDAFLDKEGKETNLMFVSAYANSVVKDKIRSLSNKTPLLYTDISDMRTNIDSRGTGFIGYNISRYFYLQCLIWLFTKNCNTKSLLEYTGGSKEPTGYLNKTDLFYSSQTGYKLLGIENFMVANIFLEGLSIVNGDIKYKIAGGYDQMNLYKTVINNDLLKTGYISKLTIYDGKIVLPLLTDGSSSSLFGIKYNNNVTSDDTNVPLVMNIGDMKLGKYKSAYSLFTFCKEEV